MSGWEATITLWATAIRGTLGTGPVRPTSAHAGWNRTMMDSSTSQATGMAIAAGSTTTINGTKAATTTGTITTTTGSGAGASACQPGAGSRIGRPKRLPYLNRQVN